MQSWNTRLVTCLSRRESGTTLACVRAVVCLVVLYELATAWFSGVAEALWMETPSSLGGVDAQWLEFVGGATPQNIALLVGVVAASALLAAFGLLTRPAL